MSNPFSNAGWEHKQSKLFLIKYKLTIAKVLRKYQRNGEFIVFDDTKYGKKQIALCNQGFKLDMKANKNSLIDKIPKHVMYQLSTE